MKQLDHSRNDLAGMDSDTAADLVADTLDQMAVKYRASRHDGAQVFCVVVVPPPDAPEDGPVKCATMQAVRITSVDVVRFVAQELETAHACALARADTEGTA